LFSIIKFHIFISAIAASATVIAATAIARIKDYILKHLNTNVKAPGKEKHECVKVLHNARFSGRHGDPYESQFFSVETFNLRKFFFLNLNLNLNLAKIFL
jgi:hypothetical protein